MKHSPFSYRYYFLIVAIFYVVSRLFGLYSFEPHNDETLYVEFAQLMSINWSEYFDMSMDGRVYGYFNGPLSYWLGSVAMPYFSDPLLAARLTTLFFSTLGFFFTGLFFLKVWSKEAGIFTLLLLVFSEHYFLFDVLFLSEPFVFGFGALYLYATRSLLLISQRSKNSVGWFLASCCFFSLALLTKEIAKLYAILAMVLPCVVWAKNKLIGFRHWVSSYLLIFSSWGIGFLVWKWVVPPEFNSIRKANLENIHIVFSWKEILQKPPGFFFDQLTFYTRAIFMSDGLLMPLLLLFAIVVACYQMQRKKHDKCFLLFSLFLLFFFSVLPFVIAFRGHYPRHWGLGLWAWYGLAGCALAFWCEKLKHPKAFQIMFIGLMAVNLVSHSFFSYRDTFRWRQTDHALLESRLNRYNGIGIKAMLRHLTTLPEGVLLYPGSWSHPGIPIRVYRKQYPQLKILSLDSVAASLESIQEKFFHQRLYVVYDRVDLEKNDFLKALDSSQSLCRNRTVFEKRYKSQHVEAASLILCELS